MSDEQWLEGLRGAARRADTEPIPEEAGAPLGADFQAKAVARILKERTGGAGHARDVVPVASSRRRVMRALVPVAAALALAAAVVLVVRSRGDDSRLPDYVSVVGGGEQSVRGESTTSRIFRPGSAFTMTLQPARDAGPVEVRVARVVGTHTDVVEGSHRVSTTGSVSVDGRASDVLGTTAGKVTIVVVVAPAGHMPARWLDVVRDAAKPSGVRVVREAVVLKAE